MAFERFNSVGGYSVGIPAVAVVDENGVVVANVITSGNVVANVIRGTTFLYANGDPFNAQPGGSNNQLQFNNGGAFGGIPNVTWNGNILHLGNISALSISGGNNGYFLQTDGAGNLTWAAGGNGGGNGSPGGANMQVQFNDAGVFGGDAGFTYNKVTNTLYVENIASGDSSDDTVSITGNLVVTGNVSITTNITSNGNIEGQYLIGNGYYITNIQTDVANYVSQPNQSNITSLGNLQFLNIDGDTVSLGNIETSGNISAGNLNASSNIFAGNASITKALSIGNLLTVNSTATLRAVGNVNTAGSPNINLGTLANIHISGGVNGYVLTTDGAGTLSWMAGGGGGGNGEPGGSNTQIQFNNNGSFAGSPYLTYNDFTRTMQVGGNLIANSVQMGAGAYKWSTSEVYFATTSSSSPGQLLFSIPVSECSGVEFEIIATEPAGPSRQSCKISSLYYNGTVSFTEWGSMFINGGVGNFEVDYDAGNIIVQPSLQLKVTPNTSNPVTYKMLITVFAG